MRRGHRHCINNSRKTMMLSTSTHSVISINNTYDGELCLCPDLESGRGMIGVLEPSNE